MDPTVLDVMTWRTVAICVPLASAAQYTEPASGVLAVNATTSEALSFSMVAVIDAIVGGVLTSVGAAE
jgi:hypothetical protein